MRRLLMTFGLVIFSAGIGQPVAARDFSSQDSTKLIEPRKALLYAAICPGLGQIYVKKPWKAALVVATEGYHLYQCLYYNKIYGKIRTTQSAIGMDVWTNLSESQKKDSVLVHTGYRLTINSWRVREKRNKYAWWCAAIYLISMLDAYVDAHLYYFPTEQVELSLLPSQSSEHRTLWNCKIAWSL